MERIIEKEISASMKKIQEGFAKVERMHSKYQQCSEKEQEETRTAVQEDIIHFSQKIESLLEEIEDLYHNHEYSAESFRPYIERLLAKFKHALEGVERDLEDTQEDGSFIEENKIVSLEYFPREHWFYLCLSKSVTLTLYGLLTLYKGWVEQLIDNIQRHVLLLAPNVFSEKEFYDDGIQVVFQLLGLKYGKSEQIILPVQEETKSHLTDTETYLINKHLSPFRGELKGQRIMSNSDFSKLVEYTKALVSQNTLPANITPLDVRMVSTEFIRRTFYNLHKDLYRNAEKRKFWIEFLNRVFPNLFKGNIETHYAKFSVLKRNYAEYLKLIKKYQ